MKAQAPYLTPAEVAAEWRCSTDTVLRALDRGELDGFRHGRLVRITRASVDRFVARHASGDQLAGPRRRRRTA
jgi:excisionase family DNA binding protein